LAGLWIVNQNWFKRQEVKYKYQMKKAKLKQKYKLQDQELDEKPSTIQSLGQLAPLIKKLDQDQIQGLIDTFTGDEPEEDSISSLMPLAQSVLQGLNSNKKPDDDTEKGNY